MSAIFGAINLTGNKIPDSVKKNLKNGFKDCVIDRYEEIDGSNLYMGCGIQYFTEEAKFEQLPLQDNTVFFDADVMLDNRSQLLGQLGKKDSSNIADGQILYEYFSKYGEKSLNNMLGAYCFISYDCEQNEITIVTDAVGYRFVYYFIDDNTFYFSSLMKPLEKIMNKREVNSRWIADYIGQDNLNMFTESEETPIVGLYRVAPAHIMKVNVSRIDKKRYWDPAKDVKKIRCKNDEEYKQKFLDLYQECVKCLLRANGETAIMLSGGYDSTSVACLAAPELDKRGKKLYAYTSVPFEGYQSEFDSSTMVDETELVLETQNCFPNIECEFMHMPEMNGWYDRKFYMNIAEMPYKSPQNMLWMFESMKRAHEKNAHIMLSGAFGNGTVSFDNKEIYLTWLFQHFKWIRLYNEITVINKKHHYTRKSLIKSTIRNAFGIGNRSSKKDDFIVDSFVKKEFLEKNGTLERLQKLQKYILKTNSNHKMFHDAFITLDVLRHYGEFSQKNSLYTGVILRDPTRDKRMIEFTYGIPYSQFTNNGVFRRLITEYMNGIVPEHIIKEQRKGRQSADLKARMCKNEEKIVCEMMQCFERNMKSSVIDCNKAIQKLKQMHFIDMTDFELVRLIFTAGLLEYLENF